MDSAEFHQLQADVWLARRLEEMRQASDDQARALLLSVLQIVDSFDRLCSDRSFGELPFGWQDSLRLVRAKMLQILEEHLVAPIPSVGERLDPSRHRVVETCAGPGKPETIVRELLAGYLWKGQVLRTAEVVVVATDAIDNA